MKLGNKAASLVQMRDLKLPVPDFFVISTEHFQIYKNQNSFPEELREFLNKNFDSQYQGTWAVRSSSTKEDSQNFSFAGLFESFLGLKNLSEIEEAIIKCWQSTDSERVKNYAQKKGVLPADIEMAVIVQKFIEPDCAGVLFTTHPLTGNDQEMFLEVCQGRGEKLVSGHVTPDQLRLSWLSPLQILEHQKNDNASVSAKNLEQLQFFGQKLQAHYGCPQDIEFAIKDERIFLVQSRPITKLQFTDSDEEWSTADFRDGGVSSDVVSPLTWSLYEKIFASSLPEYLRRIKLITPQKIKEIVWYKVFYARPYWNLKAVKDVMSQVPEFNEKNFDEDLSIPITYEGHGRTTPLTALGLIKILPTAFALNSEFKAQMKRSENLLQNFSSIENFYLSMQPSQLNEAELMARFKHLIYQDYTYVESEYFQTIYNASNAKMELLSALKSLQKIDPSLEYIKLISDLGELEATLPAFELMRIATQFKSDANIAAVQQLLSKSTPLKEKDLVDLHPSLTQELWKFTKRFYYHSERELDLRIPRWSEDYSFILKTLTQLFHSTSSLQQHAEAKAKTHQLEIEKLKTAFAKSSQRWLPGSKTSLLSKLERTRRFLKLREEIRCHSTKMYYFIRQMVLEIAQRQLPSESQYLIFYATYEKILGLLEKKISVQDFITQARQTESYTLGFRRYKNPNEIGYRYNFVGQKLSPSESGAQRLKGIGCSAGIIRAKARVVFDISEASALQSGEILVTRFTDPGWTPLFGLASGVVCENGGLLSHAALISREYGIPSVLNVKEATSLIQNGQEIELDGLKGEVSLL